MFALGDDDDDIPENIFGIHTHPVDFDLIFPLGSKLLRFDVYIYIYP